ncbi:MAG: polyprenyl synthetase family protein [Phycisphaerales bacterium]|nr:polyprenyl synthetase family protein [Phycisphaerae bacterium]NNF43706.1 polyprenyl synthetase family protein [Phycisphaerales bacterium]NNM25456.1 polyprenyl synthetase family protein [Phycisphaerales bacterium]
MLDLAQLDRPMAARLARELEEVKIIFERQLASELSAVNGLCVHIEQYRGKMLRPTLVLLSGLSVLGDEPLTPAHRTVAAVTEMIHMATLVHDDVLDEAEVRRRGATVNHLWGNETAVMLGDYLISNAFHLCSTIGDPAINLALGEVTNTLCEGELAQLHHRDDFGLDEATYLEIIRRKTASLIGACCQLGAQLAGAPTATTAALGRVGIALGIAFQIQDDLLDLLGNEAVVGKTLGLDLSKGKLTLPVIAHLSEASPAQRATTLRALETGDATTVRTALRDSGAVAYAQTAARRFVDDARAELTTLPASPGRVLFDSLAMSVVARDR